jgi:hypothetical protein
MTEEDYNFDELLYATKFDVSLNVMVPRILKVWIRAIARVKQTYASAMVRNLMYRAIPMYWRAMTDVEKAQFANVVNHMIMQSQIEEGADMTKIKEESQV